MEKIVKIRAREVFFLLFLSRFFITLTFIPTLNVTFPITDKLARITFSAITLLITSIPIYLLSKSDTRANLLDKCNCMSKLYGKLCSLIYALVFMFSTLSSIARFDIFATSVIFPQTSFSQFLILIILASTVAALYGIEALGRSSGLIFGVVVVSFIFIYIAVAKDFDWLNFSPLFYEGVKPPLQAGIITTTRTIELSALLILMPKITGNVRKGIVWWIIGTNFFIFVLAFFMIGIMGEYVKTQLFSVYTLTVIAQFEFLQKLDVILTGSWIICIFVKISLMLILFKECMRTLFTNKYNNLYIYIGSAILCVISFFLTPKAYSINYLLNPVLDAIMYSLTIIIIPITVLIYEKVRAGKNNEK